MGILRKAWHKFVEFDRRIHEQMSTRYPKAVPSIDRFLITLVDKVISSPIFGIALTLVLVVLGIAGVHILVLLCVGGTWIVVFLWIARSERLRRLTIGTRLVALAMIGLLLAVGARQFGDWALRQHVEEQIEENTGETKTANNQPQVQASIPTSSLGNQLSSKLDAEKAPTYPKQPRARHIGPLITQSTPSNTTQDPAKRPFIYKESVSLINDETTVQVVFHNASDFPATNVTTQIAWISTNSEIDWPTFEPQFAAPTSSGDVAPELRIASTASTGKKEYPAIFDLIKQGSHKAYVFGEVRYRDLQGNSYEPRFCVQFVPENDTFQECPANAFVAGEKP
jgi:hypothetical protein